MELESVATQPRAPPQITLELWAGLLYGYDSNFTRGIVHRNCPTLGRVTVGINLTAVGTRLLSRALSRVQADDIVA